MTKEYKFGKRGFAGMDKAKHLAIASMGGKRATELGVAHRFTSEEARAAGKKGGRIVAQNREHMLQIGRKGGEVSKQ